MGIWDWFWQQLFGPPADSRARRDGHGAKSATATATLEPVTDSDADPASQNADCWWACAEAELTELSVPQRPELSTEALALENCLLEQLDGHDLTLPPMPHVPEKVLRRLRKRASSMQQVAEDIADDQVIAAAVLRLANSPLYRGRDRITGLTSAVVRLGNNAVRMLMLHESVRSMTFGVTGPVAELAVMHWLRAQAAGYIMRGLSQFTGTDPEESFLAGLLQDIGNVVVLRTAQQQYRIAGFTVTDRDFDYLCYECQQEFGELIADAWSLPDDLQLLIRDHHDYPQDDDPLRTQRLQLHVTAMLCSLLGYTLWQPYDLLGSRSVSDLNLADNPAFEQFLDTLPESLEKSIQH